MKHRCVALFCALTCAAFCEEHKTLVDRVGATGFIQLEAESFNGLTARQKELAYWLSEASIAINPIIYDQLSRFGLRQKRLLEAVIQQPPGVIDRKGDPTVYEKILNYTKLFWANRGNHHEQTAQKFLPGVTFDELKAFTPPAYRKDLDELRPSIFDPDFEPMMTAKNPPAGIDILTYSANNFYGGVSTADLKGFNERYPLNSRLAKVKGQLQEQVYRTGTPDGSIPPGLYAEYLAKANQYLEKAAGVAEPAQAEAIRKLIRFYQTGDPRDWLAFGILWVQNNATVDFDNGFIEVYRDVRGAKGTSQSFVTVTDLRLNSLMTKISDNAQYFEDRAPWLPQYRKQGVKPPLAKAVETLIETGDFHVNTTGDNLPNENEIHEKYGSKSFLFTGSSRAISDAVGFGVLREFAASPEEIAIGEKYGREANDLLTAMHEIIGHGSGKLNPKLTHEPAFYLKQYTSTLEEARADLVAMWNVFDPKLQAMGLVSSPEVAKAMYYAQTRVALTQLQRNPKGSNLEEDHQRNRQLIVNYIMDKTGAMEQARRDGKTYLVVRDFEKMRQGVGMLLGELMRIKAEGDFDAIKALIDKYAVHFDPALRDEVLARYEKLDVPAYWCGINPQLSAKFSVDGAVTSVSIDYSRDFVKQQLEYSAMYKGR